MKELTDRQIDVLTLLAAGCTYKEAAKWLFISEHTVKHTMSRILAKLNAKNAVHAAVIGVREGYLPINVKGELE